MNQDFALSIALQTVAFVMSDEDLQPRFFALTGSDRDTVRQRLEDPEFLVGALDFLLGNERDLLRFCQTQGIACEHPRQAKLLLAGGQHWESI